METAENTNCPVCGREYVRKKEHGETELYIHEERGATMGMNLIEDSCKHET